VRQDLQDPQVNRAGLDRRDLQDRKARGVRQDFQDPQVNRARLDRLAPKGRPVHKDRLAQQVEARDLNSPKAVTVAP
jgi:hypothetical protein